MKKYILYLFGILGFIILYSCTQITKATDLITNPTPREIYAREYKEFPAVYTQWESTFKKAFNDSIIAKLPYLEQGVFYGTPEAAYSYVLELKPGDRLHTKVLTDSTTYRVFIDLYLKTTDSLNPFKFIAQADYKENTLNFTVDRAGEYKVLIQPEINSNTPYILKIWRTPLYAFPVLGKGNAAIQSFWGANRDGGKRSHEGLDIFAARGTPALAASDGWISSTGNRGLGGKQVWLRAGLFGHSLYYAHLDSIAVSSGTHVKIGDTLGFVGNTGNARTTSPHLHFGIYARGGALNPLPYVFEGTEPLNPEPESHFNTRQIVVHASRANLRNAAFLKAKKIGEAKRMDTLRLLGNSHDWLHVETSEDLQAYMHKSLAKGI